MLGEFLKHFALLGVGKLNSNFGDGPANPKLLCLDASSLTNNSEFTQWLDEEIAWCITLAVDHVIHASDPISKMIAELAATRIQAFRQTTITPSVISHDDLCKESLENAKGILVVTAVAGDGGGLREISRDLREYVRTETPRHFLAAVGLPQTAESWARLKQFLERNPTKRKYGFSNWLMLPVGYDGKDSAWEQLNKLAKKAEGGETAAVEGIDQEIVNESLEQLAQLVFKSHQGFLPKHNGGELVLIQKPPKFPASPIGQIFRRWEFGWFRVIKSRIQLKSLIRHVFYQFVGVLIPPYWPFSVTSPRQLAIKSVATA